MIKLKRRKRPVPRRFVPAPASAGILTEDDAKMLPVVNACWELYCSADYGGLQVGLRALRKLSIEALAKSVADRWWVGP